MKLLLISGSLRKGSYNTHIVNFLHDTYQNSGRVQPMRYEALASIPPYTPDHDLHDLENDRSPAQVQALRAALKAADAVLIATPEYAFEIPGALKNALDWIISSGEFIDKPSSVISVSTSEMGGESAYAVLVKLLGILSAKVIEEQPLNIGRVNKKIDENGKILDKELEMRLLSKVESLYQNRNNSLV